MDADGSGEIDFDEFCTIMSKNLQGSDHLREEILEVCVCMGVVFSGALIFFLLHNHSINKKKFFFRRCK